MKCRVTVTNAKNNQWTSDQSFTCLLLIYDLEKGMNWLFLGLSTISNELNGRPWHLREKRILFADEIGTVRQPWMNDIIKEQIWHLIDLNDGSNYLINTEMRLARYIHQYETIIKIRNLFFFSNFFHFCIEINNCIAQCNQSLF